MVVKVTTRNLKETFDLAERFVEKLPKAPRLGRGALVFGLAGDLGSGKTSFVQGVAKAFGIQEHITSPTFVLLKKYQIPNTKFQINSNFQFQNLIHVDAYRLDGEHDLKLLGYNEIIPDPKNLVLVEWPERVGLSEIPLIHFKFINETTREIIFPEIFF